METQIVANYTISPPSRRISQQKLEIRKDDDEDETKEEDDDTKISATFTISPPPSSKTMTFKLLDDAPSNVEETTITATINVPINTTKKTDTPPTSPKHQISGPTVQHRSLFDIDNATSIKLAEKLQQEAKKCDNELVQSLNSNEASVGSTEAVETTAVLEDDKPDSPVPEKFAERRPSWRLKVDMGSKVNYHSSNIPILPGIHSLLFRWVSLTVLP